MKQVFYGCVLALAALFRADALFSSAGECWEVEAEVLFLQHSAKPDYFLGECLGNNAFSCCLVSWDSELQPGFRVSAARELGSRCGCGWGRLRAAWLHVDQATNLSREIREEGFLFVPWATATVDSPVFASGRMRVEIDVVDAEWLLPGGCGCLCGFTTRWLLGVRFLHLRRPLSVFFTDLSVGETVGHAYTVSETWGVGPRIGVALVRKYCDWQLRAALNFSCLGGAARQYLEELMGLGQSLTAKYSSVTMPAMDMQVELGRSLKWNRCFSGYFGVGFEGARYLGAVSLARGGAFDSDTPQQEYDYGYYGVYLKVGIAL